ncbi:MAG: hypothetical protein JWP91_952 [Fibrobacteres bacterium]|nr:hypothetical protein [Fibrobacterota bacterium]
MKPGAFRQEEPEPPGGTPLGVQILAFLCGIVVAYLGFKSTWSDFSQIRKLDHLERFRETDGRFLKVDVRKDSVGSADDFYPDVLYEYFVDGKSIWGWRLSYEEEPNSKAYWEGRLSAYAKGSPIKVYYDGDKPKDSILEKKHGGLYRIWIKMALGAGFLLTGLTLAVLPVSGWLKRDRAPAG